MLLSVSIHRYESEYRFHMKTLVLGEDFFERANQKKRKIAAGLRMTKRQGQVSLMPTTS